MHSMKVLAIAALATIAACSSDTVTTPVVTPPQAVVTTATGNIATQVDAFRTALGASNGARRDRQRP